MRSDRASRGNEMPSGVSGGEPRTPEGLWGPSPAGGSDRPGVVQRDDIEGGSRAEFAQNCLGMIAGRSSRSRPRPGRSRGCCDDRRREPAPTKDGPGRSRSPGDRIEFLHRSGVSDGPSIPSQSYRRPMLSRCVVDEIPGKLGMVARRPVRARPCRCTIDPIPTREGG